MNELHYAYAVARVRCNELTLLTASDLEQLISAPDYKSAVAFLNDKGWELDAKSDDHSAAFARQSALAWELIPRSIEDLSVLDSIIVCNDFHNLKASLKCKFTGADAAKHTIHPSVVAPESVIAAVEKHNFSLLPEFMREAAEAAYDMLVQTGNGQRADCVLDVAAMKAACGLAKSSGSAMLYELACAAADCADAKTALRSFRTGKDELFVSEAVGGFGKLEKSSLVQAALTGTQAIAEQLDRCGYTKIAEQITVSSTAFERQCDDTVTDIIMRAKSMAFGVEPVVAYYLATDVQIKNVRIILSCKLNGLSAQEIEGRVRKLYV